MPDDAYVQFADRWHRRAEVLMALSGTGAITWGLAASSGRGISLWPIAGFALLFAIGIYVVIAAEAGRGWLPGRQWYLEIYRQQAMHEQARENRVSDALRDIGRCLERIADKIDQP